VHLDTLYLFSDAQAEKKIRNGMTVKIPKNPKQSAVQIKTNPSKDRDVHEGDNLSF
jgi:hypothetical protein